MNDLRHLSKGCLDKRQTIQSLTDKARFNYFLATEAIVFVLKQPKNHYIFKLRKLRKPIPQIHKTIYSVDPSLASGFSGSDSDVASLFSFSSSAGSAGGLARARLASSAASAALAASSRFCSS